VALFQLPPKGKPPTHSPGFTKSLLIGFFENVGQRFTDDEVVMERGFAILNRPSPTGEG
jgi:hypothetical protein